MCACWWGAAAGTARAGVSRLPGESLFTLTLQKPGDAWRSGRGAQTPRSFLRPKSGPPLCSSVRAVTCR